VFELPVTSAGCDQVPAVGMDYPQYLAYLHTERILPYG
jgi:hypothetical protein